MAYTVRRLAEAARVSVRTLHHYDAIGLLKASCRSAAGYCYYDDPAFLRLQQIMFFRELGFRLGEIKEIMSQPDFDLEGALRSHRALLVERAGRIKELIATVDRTILKLKGEAEMQIGEYYAGFSDEKVKDYRREARRRYGATVVDDTEARVLRMGKEKFAALQAEAGAIFSAIRDNMAKGYDSPEVQAQVARWRQWLENFAHYPEEAAAGLGRTYSQDPEFAAFFRKYHEDLPEFLTRAIEYHFVREK